MVTTIKAIGITEFLKHSKKYMDLVEAGEQVYLIKDSLIVAKITRVDFGGEINKNEFLEGGIS